MKNKIITKKEYISEGKKILQEFYSTIYVTKEKPRIFYKIIDNKLNIFVVAKNYDDPIRSKAISSELGFFERYPDKELDFRTTISLNYPLHNIVPTGYKRYVSSVN